MPPPPEATRTQLTQPPTNHTPHRAHSNIGLQNPRPFVPPPPPPAHLLPRPRQQPAWTRGENLDAPPAPPPPTSGRRVYQAAFESSRDFSILTPHLTASRSSSDFNTASPAQARTMSFSPSAPTLGRESPSPPLTAPPSSLSQKTALDTPQGVGAGAEIKAAGRLRPLPPQTRLFFRDLPSACSNESLFNDTAPSRQGGEGGGGAHLCQANLITWRTSNNVSVVVVIIVVVPSALLAGRRGQQRELVGVGMQRRLHATVGNADRKPPGPHCGNYQRGGAAWTRVNCTLHNCKLWLVQVQDELLKQHWTN